MRHHRYEVKRRFGCSMQGIGDAVHMGIGLFTRRDHLQFDNLWWMENRYVQQLVEYTSLSKMMAFLRASFFHGGGKWGRCGAVEHRSANFWKVRYFDASAKKYGNEEKKRDWWGCRAFAGTCSEQKNSVKSNDISCFSGPSSNSVEKLFSEFCTVADTFVRTDASTGSSSEGAALLQFEKNISDATATRERVSFLHNGGSCSRCLPQFVYLPVPVKKDSQKITRLLGASTGANRPRGYKALGTTTFGTVAAAPGLCCHPASASTTVLIETWRVRRFTTTYGPVLGVAGTAARAPDIVQMSGMSCMHFRGGEEKICNSSSSYATESSFTASSTTGAAAAVGRDEMWHARALKLLPYVARDVAESPQRRIRFSALLSAALRTTQQQQHVATFLFEELRCRCALQLASLQLLAELLQQANAEATASSHPGSSYSSRSERDNRKVSNNSSSGYSSNIFIKSDNNSGTAFDYYKGLPTLQLLEGWLGHAQEALLHQFGLLLLASNALKAAKKRDAAAVVGQMPPTRESSKDEAAASKEKNQNNNFCPTGKGGSTHLYASGPMSSSSSIDSHDSDIHRSSKPPISGRPVWVGKKNFLSLVHALRSIHIHVVPRLLAGARASFDVILQQRETYRQQQRQAGQEQPQQQRPQQQQGLQHGEVRVADRREHNKEVRSLEKEEYNLEKVEEMIERVLKDFLLRGVSIGLLLSHFELLYHQTLHQVQKGAVTAAAGAEAEHQHMSCGNALLFSPKKHHGRGGKQQQQQRSLCTGASCILCDRRGSSNNGKSESFSSYLCTQSCSLKQKGIAVSRFSSPSSRTYTESYNGTQQGNSLVQEQQKQVQGATMYFHPEALNAGCVCVREAVREHQRKSRWPIFSSKRRELQQQEYNQQRAYSSMRLQHRPHHEEEVREHEPNCMATYPAVGMIKRECSPAEEFRAAAEKVRALCCRDLGAAPSLRLFMLSNSTVIPSSGSSSNCRDDSSRKGSEKEDGKYGFSSSGAGGFSIHRPVESRVGGSDISIGHELEPLQLENERDDVILDATATGSAPTNIAADAAVTAGSAVTRALAGDATALTETDVVSGVTAASDVIMFPPAVLHYVLVELLKNAMRATLHRWDMSQQKQEDEEEFKRSGSRQLNHEPSIRLGQKSRKRMAGKQQQQQRRQPNRTSGDEMACWEGQTSSSDSTRKTGGGVVCDERVDNSNKEKGGVDCMICRTEQGIWMCLSDRGVGMDAKAKKAAFKCLRKRADLLVDAAQRFFGASTHSSRDTTQNRSGNSMRSGSRSINNSEMRKPVFLRSTGSNYGSNWSDVHRRNSLAEGMLAEDKKSKLPDRCTVNNRTDGGVNNNFDVDNRRTVGGGSGSEQPKMSGFGVGLVLTRAYMQYFGGDLLVRSIPGEGTDVFLFLSSIEKQTEVLPDHPAQLQRAFEGGTFMSDSMQNELPLARSPPRNPRYAAAEARTRITSETREVTPSPNAEAEAAARREKVSRSAGEAGNTRTLAEAAAAERRGDLGGLEENAVEGCLIQRVVPAALLHRSRERAENSGVWKLVWSMPEWDASASKAR